MNFYIIFANYLSTWNENEFKIFLHRFILSTTTTERRNLRIPDWTLKFSTIFWEGSVLYPSALRQRPQRLLPRWLLTQQRPQRLQYLHHHPVVKRYNRNYQRSRRYHPNLNNNPNSHNNNPNFRLLFVLDRGRSKIFLRVCWTKLNIYQNIEEIWWLNWRFSEQNYKRCSPKVDTVDWRCLEMKCLRRVIGKFW